MDTSRLSQVALPELGLNPMDWGNRINTAEWLRSADGLLQQGQSVQEVEGLQVSRFGALVCVMGNHGGYCGVQPLMEFEFNGGSVDSLGNITYEGDGAFSITFIARG